MTFVGSDAQFPSGTIWFDPSGGGNERLLTGITTSSLTIGPAAVVHGGRGRIATSTSATVINRGRISADAPGEVLQINTVRFQNDGTLEAINGGILELVPTPVASFHMELLNGGVLNPGLACLVVPGDFTQTREGSLTLLIAGTEPGVGYGQLSVLGETVLDGALQITFASTFLPVPGMQFQILATNPEFTSGTFSALHLPSLPSGWSWTTASLYTQGTVGVVPAPATLMLGGLGLSACALRRRRTQLGRTEAPR
jgi:hypothetical protein